MKKIDVVKKIEVKDGKKKKEPTVTVELTHKEALTVELVLEKAMRGQLRMIEKPDFKTRRKIKRGMTSIKKLEEGYNILHRAENKITTALVCATLNIPNDGKTRVKKCVTNEKA